MDRFDITIERQEQVEELIQEWGFLPFFKNHIAGFSIEEMTPPDLLFGDDFNQGPWGWKGPIISNWNSAYGKFFKGKAGFVSLEWLPDFMNWRRHVHRFKKEDKDARHIYEVLVENESMISRQLKKACGFTLSRKRRTFNPDTPTKPMENPKNGMAFDSLIAGLEMGTHVCIADFEYLISKKGAPYGWGLARYCTPEAMYPDLFPIRDLVAGRTPKQSRMRILDHLSQILPDVKRNHIEKLID
jgi:hypothetical protein